MTKGAKIVLLLGFLGVVFSGFALLFLFPSTNSDEKIVEEITTGTLVEETLPSDVFSFSTVTTGDTQLTILLPAYFYNEGFKLLSRDLLFDENIKVIYKTIPTLSAYKEFILSGKHEQDIDIVLLPLDWIEGMQVKKRTLEESLLPYFHKLFTPWLLDEVTTLMPYALDPLATFVYSSTPITSISIEQLFSYSMLWNQKNKLSIPVVWGAGKNDIKLLQQGKESFEHYGDILYSFLQQFVQGEDKTLTYFLDFNSMDLAYTYDYVRFKQTYQTLEKRNTYCSLLPSACLFAYSFADIRFGYLSDQGMFPLYFSGGNRDLSTLKLQGFPLSTSSYPVRGRGFVLASGATHPYAALTFFKYYLNQTLESGHALWNTTLSAAPSIMQQQLQVPLYETISSYVSSFSFLHGSLTTLDTFFRDTRTLDMLQETYNSFSYLDTIDRER